QGGVTVGNGNPVASLNQLNLFPVDLEDDGASSIRSQGLTRGGTVQITSGTAAITMGGVIDSLSEMGTAGAVELTAAGAVNLGDRITSIGQQRGGDITITTATAGLDIQAIALESFSEGGTAGAIRLSAQDDIVTGRIASYGQQRGGQITIDSTTGDINATAILNTVSDAGGAGNVSLTANGAVQTQTIASAGATRGGDINIASATEGVAIAGELNSFSAQGTAGGVRVTAADAITTRAIFSEGQLRGGDVRLTSGANVDLSQGFIGSFSDGGVAGAVAISAVNNIVVGSAPSGTAISSDGESRGGRVELTSTTGAIQLAGNLYSLSTAGVAGDVTLAAADNIAVTGDINSQSRQRGGNITITSTEGGFAAAGSTLQSLSAAGTAGNITITTAQNVVTGNINSAGQQRGGDITVTSDRAISTATLTSQSAQGTAGNITLNAQEQIQTMGIGSAGNQRGGDITLTSNEDVVTVTDAIESLSLNGVAGDVTILAEGTVTSGDIRSYGSQQGGDVTLISGDRIDLRAATINSFSAAGAAGSVTLAAGDSVQVGGNATTSAIRSEGLTQGGNIDLTSHQNRVTVAGALDSFAADGVAGDVSIRAQTQIQLEQSIRSEGTERGGNITLRTTTAGLDLSSLRLTSESSQGTAGDVTLAAAADIRAGAVDSAGAQRGGNITMTSRTGAINARAALHTLSSEGTAGQVTLNAATGISTTDILSSGQTQGGNIRLEAGAGAIATTGTLNSFSSQGIAGSVTLNATQDITLHQTAPTIRSLGFNQGGDITITSTDGGFSSAGRLLTASSEGVAGNVTITTRDDLRVTDGDRQHSILSRGAEQGGNITLTSTDGAISTVGALVSASNAGDAGDVGLTANGNITLDSHGNGGWAVRSRGEEQGGNITITSETGGVYLNGSLVSFSPNGRAGDVRIEGDRTIRVAEIGDNWVIRSQGFEQGGDVRLLSRGGRISLGGDVNSFSLEGSGGHVALEAIGTITVDNIRTFGNLESGDVLINSLFGGIRTGDIATIAPNGTSGDVALSALGNIVTGDVISAGIDSGDITFTSIEGTILTGLVHSATGAVEGAQESTTTPTTTPRTSVSRAIATNTQEAIATIEQQREHEFSTYFGRDLTVETMTPESIQGILATVYAETGNTSAIVYVTAPNRSTGHLPQPATATDASANPLEQPLELLLFTLGADPIRITVPEVERDQLFSTITDFRNQLILSERRGNHHYLSTAQQLYDWLIAPLESELGANAVDTLLFSMDSGLRGLPIAALHDGERFLVEKYSMGMVPSLGLMDTQYRPLDHADVLAMGADTFVWQNPLPAVPLEVGSIIQMRDGVVFLNEAFTQANLTQQRQQTPYRIIHLATHAAFNPGTADQSYIQLWGEERLNLHEIQTLGWDNPAVDLLVLSACQTAVGNAEAELGFAGLAVASGVRSALASLWTVSDEGTLALMTDFYAHLDQAPIKSEALRQSQLAMIHGQTRIAEGQLVRESAQTTMSLSADLTQWGDRDLSHPYYWSGFTMIGSPW
ncbi:MAG: CHAT domain-containing protein, partial [Cyanothece sp. SIO2G6]|nr:CHAT domain-containing protein [Cyanothece sp. SIO2G6]